VTRVLVIDDHPIVLQGCRQLLADAGVDHIMQARSLIEGFRLYRTEQPDMIIVDLTMGRTNLGGMSFIRRVRANDQRTPVLVFTMYSDPVIVRLALEVGATGYALKDTSADELMRAFQKVCEGQHYLPPSLASEVAAMQVKAETDPCTLR
jgi:DNA-binding NarL/FixJ family response regulator